MEVIIGAVGVSLTFLIAIITATWKLATLINNVQTSLSKDITDLRAELTKDDAEIEKRVSILEWRVSADKVKAKTRTEATA